MAVPKYHQLHAGLGVNIVLKADQRSGKLTAGQISDILTRGDHPRGIKVRLSNGHIGRVQSLSSSNTSSDLPRSRDHSQASFLQMTRSETGGLNKKSVQRDARNDEFDPSNRQEERSLADYIKKPGKLKRKGADQADSVTAESTVQALLEAEFPKLDNALVAAIATDYSDIESAREILRSLS